MSGGVDSSFAAAALMSQGWEVIGVHFRLWNQSQDRSPKDRIFAAEPSLQKTAQQLGIQLRIIDQSDRFRREIVDYFVKEYLQGRTPNPCALCNPKIKFAALVKLADELKASHISTGHYARVDFDGCQSECRLLEAADKSKDQSYFLFLLEQETLRRLILPLGNMTKSEVKKRIKELGLEAANTEESQDVCFALSKDYAAVIESLEPSAQKSGDMVDLAGKKIGRHQGIYRYTIGQHRGLALSRPDLFVVGIDAKKNQVVVDNESFLFHRRMTVSGLNWLSAVELPISCQAKIRYRFEKAACTVEKASQGVLVVFDQPQRAITPGQAAVFYRRERVLGGGWIEKAFD